MVLDGTSHADIAATLHIGADELRERLDVMIGRLRVEVPLSSGGV
jgi:hypothetical protein